ncbi:MAG: hypothetical protein U0132_15340 [Gemmatimonadaceae bacterium]
MAHLRLRTAGMLLLLSTVARAQSTCPATSVPFARVASSIQHALVTIGVPDTEQVRTRLDSVRSRLSDDFAYSYNTIGRGSQGTVAKRDQNWKMLRDAMPGRDGVFQRVLNRLFQSTVQAAIDSAGIRDSLAPVDAMMCIARDVRLFEGTEKLRRFEKKFGPGSVKLNGLEVLLNYGAQFVAWPPLFGVNADFSPRPWEIVAAYRTTYLTVEKTGSTDTKRRPQAVSVAEFGLRHYNFGKDWGVEDAGWLSRALKPGSFSLGVLVGAEANGALKYPWSGTARVGPYLAWGGFKVGYLTGHDKRLIVSREVMVIPYLF